MQTEMKASVVIYFILVGLVEEQSKGPFCYITVFLNLNNSTYFSINPSVSVCLPRPRYVE